MKYILILFFSLLFISCNSKDKRPLIGKTVYQQKLNSVFKDASKSPLKSKDLKTFKGLDFYPIDSSYIITASIEKTPDSPFLAMPTNTDETSGGDSYGGGRYMDVFKSSINTNGTVELNFNNTYNPYCAYNVDYSCPLTPRNNHLNMEILAGVKDFKKQ